MHIRCKFYIYSCVVLLCSVITGCATNPESFGLTNHEWQSLDQKQQEQLLANVKNIENEHTAIEKTQHAKTIAGPILKVKIYNGAAMMPPFTDWKSYKPAAFTVAKGECQDVNLLASEGDTSVALRSCYRDNALQIDASRYDPTKKYGSVTINSSPLWQQGFAYTRISTTGYARLKDVTVEIKEK